MSKALSLKLKDEIFEAVEELRKIENTPRNTYINKALKYYNEYYQRRVLAKQLKKEVAITKESSMAVLHEFELLDDPIFE